MIKGKKNKGWLLGMAAALAVSMMPALPAYAGYSENIIDGSSCETELSGGIWYNPDEDVVGQDGMIIFPEDSTESSRVITKEVAEISEQSEILLKAGFTLDFSQFPEGEEFMFAMGLQSVAAMSGEQNNLEVVFANDGGNSVKILAYETAEEPTVVLDKTSYSGNAPQVEIEVSTRQTMKLLVNGTNVYEGDIPLTAEGSLGFLQSGNCAVKVKDFYISRFSYDRPENPDFEEDFETGFFNANVLKSKVLSGSTYSPSYMKIEEYNGSNVLMIKNTGICYIGTKYAYSNFEMTFDIPFYQHESVYNEAGEVTQPATRELGVSFGADGIEHTNESGYTEATDLFCFTGPDQCYNIRTNEAFKSDITDVSEGKPFSVRLSVVDGQVNLDFKYIGEENWHSCASYKLDHTPKGNILIWAPTGGCTTYAIDNIKVVNKDKDANTISVDYKSSQIDIPEDFEYTPQGLNYREDAATEEETAAEEGNAAKVSYVPVYIVGAVCVVLILGTVVLCGKKKRKDVQTDEKK